MKKLQGKLLPVLVFSGLLLILIHLYKDKLLEAVANHFLASHQVQISLPQGFELSWRHIYFPEIALSYQQKLQHFSNVRVAWQNFALRRIHIEQLNLDLPQSQTEETSAAIPEDLLDKYRQWRQLPQVELEVKRLKYQEQLFNLALSHKKHRDKLTIQYQDYNLDLAAAYKQQKPYFEYQLSADSKKVLVGKVLVDKTRQWQMTGNNQLYTQRVFPLLQTLVELPDELEGVAGTVDFDFDVSLASTKPEDITASIQLSEVMQLAVKHSYSPEATRIELVKGSSIHWQQSGLTLSAKAANLQQQKPDISLNIKHLECDSQLRCQFDMHSRAQLTSIWLKQFVTQPVDFEKLEVQTQGKLALSTSEVEFNQLELGKLQLTQLSYQGKTLAQLPVTFSGIVAQANLQQQSWQLQARKLLSQVRDFALEELRVHADIEVNSVVASSEGGLAAQLTTDSLAVIFQGTELPVLSLKSQLDIKNELASVKIEVKHQQQTLISSELKHQLADNRGWAELRLEPVTLSYLQSEFLQLAPQWPKDLSFVTGDVSAQAELNWQAESSWYGLLELQAADVSGVYADSGFHQLNLSIPATFSAKGARSAGQTQLKVELVDIGLPVENIQILADWNSAQGSVQVHQASANMLGGKIIAEGVNYTHGEQSQIDVQLQALQLNQILELIGQESIKGQASISGHLPLLLFDNNVRMDAGRLGADGKGFIQYQADVQQTAQLDPSLKFVNDALSNYHFDTLKSMASYDPQGELILETKLTGSNPDMHNNNGIHLNLNLSNNIPQMLKSLRIGRDITQLIERKLNKEQ